MVRAVVVLGLLVSAASPAVASEVMTVAERAATDAATERGRAIYLYDQAAWHTTDTMREDVPDLKASGIRGWVVTPGPKSTLRVVYYALENGTPRSVYRAGYDGAAVFDRHVARSDEKSDLTDEELRIIRAQTRAREILVSLAQNNTIFSCSNSQPNIIALPLSDAARTVAVYFLAPQEENSRFPLGGHYRVDVPETGEPKWRAFTKSCIDMPAAAKGERKGMFFITHVLDPQPTEIHTFTSLTSHMAIAVGSIENKSIWGVDNGRITLQTRNFDAKH